MKNQKVAPQGQGKDAGEVKYTYEFESVIGAPIPISKEAEDAIAESINVFLTELIAKAGLSAYKRKAKVMTMEDLEAPDSDSNGIEVA
jgi:hypothetical protein